jgi:hypothetical protein
MFEEPESFLAQLVAAIVVLLLPVALIFLSEMFG